jgi:hypothetical protein
MLWTHNWHGFTVQGMKRRECILFARVESTFVNRRRISPEELEELVSQQDALKAQLQTMYDTE